MHQQADVSQRKRPHVEQARGGRSDLSIFRNVSVMGVSISRSDGVVLQVCVQHLGASWSTAHLSTNTCQSCFVSTIATNAATYVHGDMMCQTTSYWSLVVCCCRTRVVTRPVWRLFVQHCLSRLNNVCDSCNNALFNGCPCSVLCVRILGLVFTTRETTQWQP